MKQFFLSSLVAIAASASCFAQSSNEIINTNEVERIERTLSSDDMRGRKVFTPDIERAANFIATEFKAAGVQPIAGNNGYLQNFVMLRPKFISATGNFDGTAVDEKNIVAFTTKPDLKIDQGSGFQIVNISASDTFMNKIRSLIN